MDGDEVDKEEDINGMELLLHWLSPDREEATALYMKLWQGLVFYFLRFFDDAESLAAVAVDRTLEKLTEGTVKYKGKAQSYVFGVARIVKLEKFRDNLDVPLNEETTENPASEGGSFSEELYQILEECIGKLPYDDQQLLLEYIYVPKGVSTKQHRIDLAAKWKITIGHLRVKILRLKETLRRCAKKRKKEL